MNLEGSARRRKLVSINFNLAGKKVKETFSLSLN